MELFAWAVEELVNQLGINEANQWLITFGSITNIEKKEQKEEAVMKL